MQHENTLAYAQKLDAADPLKSFRNEFLFPQHNGQDVIYFCGNSLGLQPKSVEKYVTDQLKNWADYGVEGHFKTKTPWMYYQKTTQASLAKIVAENLNRK